MDKGTPYKIIFYFESFDLIVGEIKRLDAPANAPKSEYITIFLWDKLKKQYTNLHFESINDENGIVQRHFKEGSLKTDGLNGTFMFHDNYEQIQLEKKEIKKLPDEILVEI